MFSMMRKGLYNVVADLLGGTPAATTNGGVEQQATLESVISQRFEVVENNASVDDSSSQEAAYGDMHALAQQQQHNHFRDPQVRQLVQELLRVYPNVEPDVIEEAYLLFQEHYARREDDLLDCQQSQSYRQIYGLEYLYPQRALPLPTQGYFKNLTASQLRQTMFRPSCQKAASVDVGYIVDKRSDFIYTRVIEMALLMLFRSGRHRDYGALVDDDAADDDETDEDSVNALDNSEEGDDADVHSVNRRAANNHDLLTELQDSINGETVMPDQQQQLVQLLLRASRYRLLKRTRLLDLCHGDHPHTQQLCPAECVIYTRYNSAFFEFCRDTLQRMEQFCPNLCRDFMRLEFVSFYVVLFLCGDNDDFRQTQRDETTLLDTIHRTTQYKPLQPVQLHQLQKSFTSEEEHAQEESFVSIDIGRHQSCEIQHYQDVNQWVKVPFWYLAMWESYTRAV
jgi:hypothetical protein